VTVGNFRTRWVIVKLSEMVLPYGISKTENTTHFILVFEPKLVLANLLTLFLETADHKIKYYILSLMSIEKN
jgi:hypothetical protein